MNWLAHILLSENSIDYQLGNLLADPLKGKAWDGASEQLLAGYRMHSSIDVFTDSNAYVRQSKSRLGESGYLKGVVIDIAYDYLLIKNWKRYSKVSFDKFVSTFYRRADGAIASYPDHARAFVKRIIDSEILTSYGSFNGLETAFQRIDVRLSERVAARESAVAYLPVLQQRIDAIGEDFSQFFPQLVAHFKSKAGAPFEHHWLR